MKIRLLSRSQRRLMVLLLIVFLVSLIIDAGTGKAFSPKNLRKIIPDEGMRVYFIQLKQGEATLIQLENGEAMLVDTGSKASQRELIRFLREQQIEHIHHLVITSQQEEFVGNLELIVDLYEPRHIYYPFYLDGLFTSLEKTEHAELQPLIAGDTIRLDEACELKVFHPQQRLSLSLPDNSLVFQLVHGQQRFLFTGTISKKVEKELMKQYDLRSHILKVSNFGSMNASSEDFLEEVDAHVAIIFYRSADTDEPEVMERLESSWLDVYPVRKHGHILVVSQKEDYLVFVLPS
ncbi:hydrolase (metallo-beta-lactamase superfamily) [Caldalkalibacillus thermarum TA2.A1]|uniref:Hydrolase (Metallo-beta-lactamase superfamily) n=1 Tax=Caldalkalibacillus thermarum (strain TA2.A1) TaxID=986075 RepID=F5L8V9_CALTT|nr:MBL fold metallo-hydrolase [Caldalkalibacillus thermarum]EGL82241.1 hydrolase (metallo-beta-lactamase superfamily) [Caldalkalibacillus thermarum TA2.A1]QZT32744.1 hypothetical protein HUR95_10145 [Caldalkalibacillus thermarum TA2.A1]GGK24585.1 hypothetical protein GCM10010965_16700 [Caldalkalibacillus thermarum]